MSMVKTDILVLGSGIAGLTCSIKIAEALPGKQIKIVTKADKSESNTKYAQGGVAVVLDEEDSFQSHVDDTLKAGDYHNNKAVVEMVVKEGPQRLREIIKWGAAFDKNPEGAFSLGMEGGHSANRIVHHKDITGYELERALLNKIAQLKNVEVLQHHYAIDLITDHQVKEAKPKLGDDINCYGAYILDHSTNNIFTYVSEVTLIATGGAGQAYDHTTNPSIATGDGIAMAYRAKAMVAGMEFIQFHPTALYEPGVSPNFLITEAVRGEGGHLKTLAGERFMEKYDDRLELASRDIVSRCIDKELKESGSEHVWLDCTHLGEEVIDQHFPNISKRCLSKGVDMKTEPIPVVPAAHYVCGGINVDQAGRTTMNRLYGCGECTNTGLHGANRLASNSLLEALVYSHNIAKDIIAHYPEEHKAVVPLWNEQGTTRPKELALISHNRKELQSIMSDLVGIVRTDARLKSALRRLSVIYQEIEDLYNETKLSPQLCEVRNLINIAYMIVKQSSERKENLGAFYNEDLSEA